MLFQVRNAREDIKACNIGRTKGVILLRNQRQRSEDERSTNQSLRRSGLDHEKQSENRRAATRSTLICIFICGSLLLSLGVVILVAGLFAPPEGHDNTPWLVIGPTCIVLGVLVLLLSVEIIIKLRRISSGVDSDSPAPARKGGVGGGGGRKSWDSDADPEDPRRKATNVSVHPSKPNPASVHK